MEGSAGRGEYWAVARMAPQSLSKKSGLRHVFAAGPAYIGFWAECDAKPRHKRYQKAPGGCDEAAKAQKQRSTGSLHQMGDEAIEPNDGEHAREVVAERHQAPFAAHLVEAAHQKVAVAGPAFEGAERVLGERSAAAHLRISVFHPRAVSVEHGFMLPTLDGTRRCLGRETAGAHRAGVAIGLAAHIPDLDPAVGIDLATFRWLEKGASRAAIGIHLGLVDELFMADAALCFEPCGSLGRWDVGNDPILLAVLERIATVIAGIGKHRQRLGAELVLRGLSHFVKLAGVVAVIDDLACHDEFVLVVDRDLDVVAGDRLAGLRQ